MHFIIKNCTAPNLLIKKLNAIYARHDVGMRHCGCSELASYCDRSETCLGKKTIVRGWMISAAVCCQVTCQRAETSGYDLVKIGRLIRASPKVQNTLNQPFSIRMTTVEKKKEYVFTTFDRKEDFKEESVHGFCNPVFNAAVEPIYKLNRDRNVAL